MKNVSYENFSDIGHEHNHQPIVNMWNGMHFPLDNGLEVVQRYVLAHHFTNILCYREELEYRPWEVVHSNGLLSPLLEIDNEGGWKARMGSRRPPPKALMPPSQHSSNRAVASNNWRAPAQQQSKTSGDEESSAAPTRPSTANSSRQGGPPMLDGPASPMPRPGQMVSCIVNERGEYVPVTPQANHHGATSSGVNALNQNLMPSQQAFQTYSNQLSVQPQSSFGNMRGIGSNDRGGNHRGGNHRGSNYLGGFSIRGAHRGIGEGRSNGRGDTQSPLRTGHVQDNGDIYIKGNQEAHPTSPAVLRMRSEVGMADPFSTPRRVRASQSFADMPAKPTFAPNTAASSASLFQRAASSANFVPKTAVASPADKLRANVHATPSTAHTSTAASSQTDATNMSTSSYSDAKTKQSSLAVAIHSNDQQSIEMKASPEFRTPTAKVHAAGVPPFAAMPSIEDTPSHRPGSRHADVPTSTSKELIKLDGPDIYPTPTDGALAHLPKDLNHKQLRAKADGAHKRYLAILYKQHKIEAELQLLFAEKQARLADEAEAAAGFEPKIEVYNPGHDGKEDWASTASRQKRNISPVRAADGRAIYSDSDNGADGPESAKKVAFHRAINRLARDTRVKGDVEDWIYEKEVEMGRLVASSSGAGVGSDIGGVDLEE